jgi:hypothetical protein
MLTADENNRIWLLFEKQDDGKVVVIDEYKNEADARAEASRLNRDSAVSSSSFGVNFYVFGDE